MEFVDCCAPEVHGRPTPACLQPLIRENEVRRNSGVYPLEMVGVTVSGVMTI